jgi:L-histidine N-alpha-methyltransferase
MLTYSLPVRHVSEFADAVRDGLTKAGQKELPSKYLYDEVGSSLFETICVLPEYGLTRADARLLETHAKDIVERMPLPISVAELGSGTGKKTRWSLEIDLVSVVGYEQTYLDGLRAVVKGRDSQEHLLVLFLGSTIGNFDREMGDEFLREVRSILRRGDALLLGTDLEKDEETQILAYDDPAGVTAAFNKNLLARINRELGADFDLSQFRHEARWNRDERRIEMHLRSLCAQSVTIPAALTRVDFAEGETIWTESSHKYRANEVLAMAKRTGYRCEGQWIDEDWPFAQNLLICE